jgi:hypothetical protein
MPALEARITDLALKRMRSLKTEPATDGVDAREPAVDPAKRVKVREAQFSDFEQVCALNLRMGQGPDSIENWQRLWRDNPALDGAKGAPLGWVLESPQVIVGFLGSIRLQYQFRGSELRAAATCRFAVDTAYRAFSHLLVVSFFRQKDVDLFLDTTATPAAGKIMTALKASPMPQSDYGTVLFWVLDRHGFAKAVSQRIGAGALLSHPIVAAGTVAVGIDQLVRRRPPRAADSRYRLQQGGVREMGPAFDRFWRDCAQDSATLWAKRSREIMYWHFEPPGNRRAVVALGCYSGDELHGYAIVRHEPSGTEPLRRSLVADLVVRHNDPDVTKQLLAAAWRSAKQAGCHVLEMIGFPDPIREAARQSKPYTREYPAPPFFFKARDREFQESLLSKAAWYACPFDGDTTLWP